METPLLAAALIVKNEEHNLPGCIDSLRALGSLVSEICVYDTGSTDRTVEIARAADCVVAEGYWDEDFARARNAAAAMTHAKWVLSIDADERIAADAPALRKVLRDGLTMGWTGADCLRVVLTDVRDGIEVQAHTAFRIFRPSRCHWVGRLHERVVPAHRSGDPAFSEPGRHVVLLEHLGYSDPVTHEQKLRRNLQVADAEVRAMEEGGAAVDDRFLFALVDRGRTRGSLGDIQGSLADLRQAWAIPSNQTYRAFGGELLVETLIGCGEYDEAGRILDTLRREGASHPGYCDWLESRSASARGDTRRALELLRTIDVLASSLGLVVKPRVLLEDRLWAAVAEGEHLEAAACLVNLMAAQGVVRRKFGDLLLTLSRELPTDGLVELILDHDRGHLQEIAAEFELSRDPGPAIGAELRGRMRSSTVAPESISSAH